MVSSKILVAIAVLLLPLAGLVVGQGHVGDRRKAASALAKPLLERLNAEIMHPPIAAPEFLLQDLTQIVSPCVITAVSLFWSTSGQLGVRHAGKKCLRCRC